MYRKYNGIPMSADYNMFGKDRIFNTEDVYYLLLQ